MSSCSLQNQDTYKADFYQEKIASNDPEHQRIIGQIYKNIIPYQSNQNGNWDIYYYDTSTDTKTQITNHPTDQLTPSAYKDSIVYKSMETGNMDIWQYNLTTGTHTQMTTNTATQECPVTYEKYIAWLDWREGLAANASIYYYNLQTSTETRVTTNPTATNWGPAAQHCISIHNNNIVWTDWRKGQMDIYLYDINRAEEKQITNDTQNQYAPDIHQNNIIWLDENSIWKKNYNPFIPTTATQIVNSTNTIEVATISQNLISWTEQRGSTVLYKELYTKDHTQPNSTEEKITNNNDPDLNADIDEEIIAYIKNNPFPGTDDAYYINLSQKIICGDCEDTNETINPGMIENGSITPGVCIDSIDNDCDGLIDCAEDPSCIGSPECGIPCIPTEPVETICNDFLDNDCDDLIDCDDPDCFNDLACSGNATLHGYVFDDQEWPIDLATITGFPPFKPLVTTFTDIFGFYNYTVPSGVYTFKADKFGYDPDIDELTLPNGTDVEHNFTLHNATCHADCTNSENRCNKDCEGYTYQGDTCHFANETTATACHDKKKSSTQTLQTNESWYLLVDCCEGEPYYEYRPKLTVQGPMEDLYKLTSIVSKGGEPTKLHVNVWRK